MGGYLESVESRAVAAGQQTDLAGMRQIDPDFVKNIQELQKLGDWQLMYEAVMAQALSETEDHHN